MSGSVFYRPFGGHFCLLSEHGGRERRHTWGAPCGLWISLTTMQSCVLDVCRRHDARPFRRCRRCRRCCYAKWTRSFRFCFSFECALSIFICALCEYFVNVLYFIFNRCDIVDKYLKKVIFFLIFTSNYKNYDLLVVNFEKNKYL